MAEADRTEGALARAKDKQNGWVALAAVVFYPLAWLLGRRKMQHHERVPRRGPALMVFNHVSYIDPVYDAVMVHRRGRVPRFMAKDSLFRIPVLGPVLRGSGGIPVYRGTGDAQHSLRDAIATLQEGKMVLMYPEGTITRDPEHWPMLSRTGVARLALSSGAPVIPVARYGTQRVYDHYNRKLRPLPRQDITYRIGDPVDLSEYRGRSLTTPILREVTEVIMGKVRDELELLREQQAPEGWYNMRTGERERRSPGGEPPWQERPGA